jgi:hypothetical protein
MPLEQMTLRQRIVLAIVIVVLCSIVLAVVGLLIEKAESSPMQQQPCMDATERERVRDLVLAGIDRGLQNQIQQLFEIWMRDASAQPQRAMVGTLNAFSAHVRARRQAVAWDPPQC